MPDSQVDNQWYGIAHLPFFFFSFHAPLLWLLNTWTGDTCFPKHTSWNNGAMFCRAATFTLGCSWRKLNIIPWVFGQEYKNVPAHTLTPVLAFPKIDVNSPYPILHGRYTPPSLNSSCTVLLHSGKPSRASTGQICSLRMNPVIMKLKVGSGLWLASPKSERYPK